MRLSGVKRGGDKGGRLVREGKKNNVYVWIMKEGKQRSVGAWERKWDRERWNACSMPFYYIVGWWWCLNWGGRGQRGWRRESSECLNMHVLVSLYISHRRVKGPEYLCSWSSSFKSPSIYFWVSWNEEQTFTFFTEEVDMSCWKWKRFCVLQWDSSAVASQL